MSADALTLQGFIDCIGPNGVGSVCQLDAGTYTLSTELYIRRSNITIKGTFQTSRRDTILRRAAGWHYSLLIDVIPPSPNPVSNITIRDLTFDGNRAQNGDAWSSYFSELSFNTTLSVLVTDCDFIDSPNTSLVVVGRGGGGITVDHSYFGNAVIYGVWGGATGDTSQITYLDCPNLQFPDHIVISNSIFENIGEPAILGDMTDLQITGNVFTNNHSSPVPFDDDGGQIDLTVCTDHASIVGNTFQNASAGPTGHVVQGIELHANHVQIIDNIITNNSGVGISLGGAANVLVSNPNPATGVFNNGGGGIAMSHHQPGSPDQLRPLDSITIDSALVAANHGPGIWSDSPDTPITHLTITNNCLSGNTTGPMQLAGVGADAIITGNVTSGCHRPFVDDTLVPLASIVRAVHVAELRSRVNGLRRIYGLMPFAFTDGALVGGTTIKAQHVLDLREGLRQAYVAASVAAPSYTNLTAGMIISAAHMTELRNAVAAIESR